jgi:TRAP-type transport system periplasmic protein
MFSTKLIFSLLTGLLMLSSTAAAETEISFAHAGPPGTILDLTAQQFAERANARLGDSASVVVYPGGQLGSDRDVLAKLTDGGVDLALPGSVMSSPVPAFGVFEMPYLVRDRAHAARIRDDMVMPLMAPLAEEAGYRIIAVWENGFRHVTNNKRPIMTPDDLQGLKLRVPQGEWRVKMFQSYGAEPTPLAFSEVRAALESGELDGQENPFAIIYPSGLHEVQTYLSLTGHVYTPAFVTAGASWSNLDPQVQAILVETAKEMQEVALELGARFDEEFHAKLKASGMIVNEVDKDAFIEASKAIYQDFASQIAEGGMLIDKALELAGQ